MSPIYLHVYWHQHQPWYFRPNSLSAAMPWVRLHGVKDYYDMAWLCRAYEGWKQTVNLVPSLLDQLRFYTEKQATDTHLELSRKPPGELTPAEKRTALDFLFHGHALRMIHPYPRYDELWHKRGDTIDEAVHRFTHQDFLDLQVWHNLTWIDPIWRRDPATPIYAVEQKQRNFTESDKQTVLDFQQEILQQIIPLHAQLYQQKRMDLTCSAYYHPILPLLCDNSIAAVSNPHDPTPQPPFSNPQDAETQIQRGLDGFAEHFGRKPDGMWPSEGSVSDAALALMAKHGVNFAASDEGILFQSTPVSENGTASRQALYALHQIETEHGPLDFIFRDHQLSDLIGFDYQRLPAKEAALDFVRRLHTIGNERSSAVPPLINVILDGENCWEFYPNDGHDFLRYWIEAILADERIIPTTVPEYRALYPPSPTLSSIYPGSWINSNFQIWIGHPEDNAAWHQLRLAREELTRVENQLDDSTRARAWEQLYICEGSDWFWWYGDENQSDLDWLFDRLFRENLAHLYTLLSLPVPTALQYAISKPRDRQPTEGGILLYEPAITGKMEGHYEWSGLRRIINSPQGGAMHTAETAQYEIAIGRHKNWIYFWLQFDFEPRIERIVLHITKPLCCDILVPPASQQSAWKQYKNSLEGKVSLQPAYLTPEQEVWLYLSLDTVDGQPLILPNDGEIYLKGYTAANSSVYWFI